MADDIVTQLRWLQEEFAETYVGDDLAAAADEIERLRAKVAHLSAWPSFCDRPTECDVCGDVYRSEEARRG